MKAINHSEFVPMELNLATNKWARKATNALYNLKLGMAKVIRLAHQEPSFRERHLLEQDLGPEIRRMTW